MSEMLKTRYNSAYYGKGWSVGYHPKSNERFPYNAIVILEDGTHKSCGSRATLEEAAKIAVGAAYHHGTLNVGRSQRWFTDHGMYFTGADMDSYAPTIKDKGWYVRRSTTKIGTVVWIAYTGYPYKTVDNKRRHKLKTVTSRKSKTLAVEYAIKAAKETDRYDEGRSILWLERNGMKELIKLARVSA